MSTKLWQKYRVLFLLVIVIFFILFVFNTKSILKISKPGREAGVIKWLRFTEDNLNGESISMDDPMLVDKLRYKFLLPPPPITLNHRYYLSNPSVEDPSMGQSEKIRSILKNKKNGFFIECGALDGETRSNTLYLERYLNWTGLLIEADPFHFARMMGKNRRSWLSESCLSLKKYPEIVSFEQSKIVGQSKISDEAKGVTKPRHIDVQCFPIYTYFLALNITHVDFFSLDIEGGELDVLQTIPFDKVDIQTLAVEFVHVPKGEGALKSFMESKGYKVHSKVTHPNWLANDLIFVKS